MKAVIMAGGRGTRLQPLTRRLPKPMLQLLHKPTMEYIVELLTQHDIRDIEVTVCYMPDSIREYFGDGSPWNAHIQYHEESVPLGTAGGLKAMANRLDETFVVMSGDGLTDFDLTEAITVHRQRKSLATVLLTSVECPLGYGVVDLTDEGRIARFIEKPKTWVRNSTYYINTGIYILEPDILDYIPSQEPYDFGHQLFPLLLEKGMPIFGYVTKGYWSDVGTLQQYYQSQIDMVNGLVNLNLPEEVLAAR